MNQLKQKFAHLKAEITKVKGDFTLFALVLREDAPDRWDLLVAAPWASEDKDAAVKYLVSEIQTLLEPQDLIRLSKIVVADPNNQLVQAFTGALALEGGGPVEISDSIFFGVPVHHAYVYAAKRPEVPVHG